MTFVSSRDSEPVGDTQSIFERYLGVGCSDLVQIGAEVERAFHCKNDPNEIMRAPLQEIVMSRLRENNQGKLSLSQEATSYVIEEQTSVHPVNEPEKLIEEQYANARLVLSEVRKFGFRQSILANNPLLSLKHCITNPNSESTPRYKSFIKNYSAFFGSDEALKFGVLTCPLHLSISYQDPDHLFEIVRRTAFLTPLMYLVGENSGGYMEGSPQRISSHFAMRTNSLHGQRGGIPQYFFQSESGEQFIKHHIEWVSKSRMMMYFDDQGDLVTPSSVDQMPRFSELDDFGLASRANYDLAESLTWPDGKLCNIRDSNGSPTGKRFEIRMWDTGPFQFNAMVLMASALILDPVGGRETDEILADFGFSQQPKASYEYMNSAMQAACHHNLQYLDVPFGRGTLRLLANELAPVIRRYIQRCPQLIDQSVSLLAAMEIGETDTQVLGDWVGSLDGLRWLMSELDDEIYLEEGGPSFLLLREQGRLPVPRRKVDGFKTLGSFV